MAHSFAGVGRSVYRRRFRSLQLQQALLYFLPPPPHLPRCLLSPPTPPPPPKRKKELERNPRVPSPAEQRQQQRVFGSHSKRESSKSWPFLNAVTKGFWEMFPLAALAFAWASLCAVDL